MPNWVSDLGRTSSTSLSWRMSCPHQARFRTFANGEISVKLEQSVSNYDVFVVSRLGTWIDLEQSLEQRGTDA